MGKLLTGEVALVSGGSRGIGAAVCISLAQAGAKVAVGFQFSEEEAEQVAQKCRTVGGDALVVGADVQSRTQAEVMIEQVERAWDRPSILVHSAGVEGKSRLFQDVDDEEYDLVMDTHVRGAFSLIRRVLPGMIKQRYGRIILLSSIWGESGGSGEVLYSSAKGALNGMARALAKETGPSGITVNAVAPGAIRTDMLKRQLTVGEQRELAAEIPVGRLGEADEVASLVRWLCGREADYLTGQVLHVDGGWYP